eukprot:2454060-Amphidinium_carterae.5
MVDHWWYHKNQVDEPEVKRGGQEHTRICVLHAYHSMAATKTEVARSQLANLFTLRADFQVNIFCGDFNQLTYKLFHKQRNPSSCCGPLAVMCGRLTQAIRESSPIQCTGWKKIAVPLQTSAFTGNEQHRPSFGSRSDSQCASPTHRLRPRSSLDDARGWPLTDVVYMPPSMP